MQFFLTLLFALKSAKDLLSHHPKPEEYSKRQNTVIHILNAFEMKIDFKIKI